MSRAIKSKLHFTWVSHKGGKLRGKEEAGDLQGQLKLVDALREGVVKAIELEQANSQQSSNP